MLITGVLCLVAAAASLALGVRALTRPRSSGLGQDPEQLVLRAVAPAQVVVGVLLGIGGAVALAGPPQVALLTLIICITGGLGTLAAGSWQGARYAARQPVLVDSGCGPGCGCAAGPELPPEPGAGCGCGCACG